MWKNKKANLFSVIVEIPISNSIFQRYFMMIWYHGWSICIKTFNTLRRININTINHSFSNDKSISALSYKSFSLWHQLRLKDYHQSSKWQIIWRRKRSIYIKRKLLKIIESVKVDFYSLILFWYKFYKLKNFPISSSFHIQDYRCMKIS